MPLSLQSGPAPSQPAITKLMSLLGALAAGIIALAIPSVYYAISINGSQHALAIEAAFLAKSIEKVIQGRPDLWEFEKIRLLELISQPGHQGELHEAEIHTAVGKLVARTYFTEARPIISVSVGFFDSGRRAGSIILRHSIRTQIITTALAAILSSLLGCLIYFIFRTYPIRKLENTLADLQRERDKSDKTLYAIGDGVISVDHSGKVLFMNRAAELLVGMEAAAAVGQPLEAVYVLRRGQENQAGEKEGVLVSQGGGEYAIEEVRTPLTGMEADPSGLVIAFRDITERKCAEEALRESEKAAKQLAQENELLAEIGRIVSSTLNIEDVYSRFAEKVREAIPFERIAVNTINLHDYTRTISYVQGDRFSGERVGSVHSLAGTGTELLVRTKSSLLVNSKNREDMIRKVPGMSSLQLGAQSMMMIPLISKDEVIGAMSVTSGQADAYAEKDLLLAERVGTQIASAIANAQLFLDRERVEAEKKKLEAQNRQLQKAESLGRMAGAIAHTFNNQLGVVIGNLDLALMSLPPGAGPVPNLTKAMEAANKAAEVSSQMLTYLGHSFDKREMLDLSEVYLRNLPIIRATIPGNVVLETDFPSPGPAVMANENQLQQVLNNLVTNAWEACDEGRGFIYLRVTTVTPTDIPAVHCYPLDWQPQDNAYACLEVTDSGSGIADKDIENLFDPFFSRKLTGRGLGLPVVLGIVKAHGGAIAVQSESGQESTFRVFLPVPPAAILGSTDAAAAVGSVSSSAVPYPSRKGEGAVLLIEDEEAVRNMTATMLKHLGFAVIEAGDGSEATELFRRRRAEIRCVLCDLTMPRLNGWETLMALRQLAPAIPVILTSGYDEAQVMTGDHPEWPQVFLSKPYKLKGLSEAIGQALADPEERKNGGEQS